MATHKAAFIPAARAGVLKVDSRPTPAAPGPGELLVRVRAIALNPVDRLQRDMGFPNVSVYPAVVGSDVAGVVEARGDGVPDGVFRLGQRVAAYTPSFFEGGKPDYGAYQEKVLVPYENAFEIPDSVSFSEAAMLPLVVQTSWSGWRNIGVSPTTKHSAADKKGVLIWGAGGSLGSVSLQTAVSMGFVVYATASERHHAGLKKLGAHRTFDYKTKTVVADIVAAAKADGVAIDLAYDASGGLNECLAVLAKTRSKETTPRVASAPFSLWLLTWRKLFPAWGGVEAVFVVPPSDAKERSDYFRFVFNEWTQTRLASGALVPTPAVKVVGRGLGAIQGGLDELKKGVSGVKLVVELD
ncbi:chaperonin 10-like protein [Zopfochytrium polystomum]|nr:chaperonin 10-like protein [Zopfochytrium polystomum]